MFVALAIIFAVAWIIAVSVSYTLGGAIHLLLVLAIISLVYNFVQDEVDTTQAHNF
jgi:hypothetical protein